MKRAALFCPGRGSYTEATLGSLPAGDPWVRRAEELRAELAPELDPLLALDGATRFEPARHLRPANASPLIWVKTMLDARAAREAFEVVCAGGNSMGWYTALAVTGALDFDDGFRLVQRMSLLQEEGAAGGQVIYPVVDGDWREDPAAVAAVERALAGSEGEAYPSIRLGGYRVLAGSSAGLAHLGRELPRVVAGKATYPLRLALHGPYHTPLAGDVAAAAGRELHALDFRRPRIALVDGRGRRFGPWTADVAELRAYTLGHQVTAPFDFTATVRVALREWGPERVVLPGPGNTLGGVVGQVLAGEGWRGIRSRADFGAIQESDDPVLVSMGR